MIAELRWCQQKPDGYQVGFELLDARDSDDEVWQQLALEQPWAKS